MYIYIFWEEERCWSAVWSGWSAALEGRDRLEFVLFDSEFINF